MCRLSAVVVETGESVVYGLKSEEPDALDLFCSEAAQEVPSRDCAMWRVASALRCNFRKNA
eukprot:2166217-Pleurochrysis_carterae.AAC.1